MFLVATELEYNQQFLDDDMIVTRVGKWFLLMVGVLAGQKFKSGGARPNFPANIKERTSGHWTADALLWTLSL